MHPVNIALQQKRVLGCVEYDHGLDIPQNKGNNRIIKTGQAIGIIRDNLREFLTLIERK